MIGRCTKPLTRSGTVRALASVGRIADRNWERRESQQDVVLAPRARAGWRANGEGETTDLVGTRYFGLGCPQWRD
jgi:hypothetical protein